MSGMYLGSSPPPPSSNYSKPSVLGVAHGVVNKRIAPNGAAGGGRVLKAVADNAHGFCVMKNLEASARFHQKLQKNTLCVHGLWVSRYLISN